MQWYCTPTGTPSWQAWTKLKAVENHENFHNKTFDTDSHHDTPIEVTAKTGLGINGWALHEFGLTGDVSPAGSGAVPPSEVDTAFAVVVLPDARQSKWDSEAELSDLELMEGASNWEADKVYDNWKEVKPGGKTREGRHALFQP